MNDLAKRLLVGVVVLSFAASVGLALSDRSERLAQREYLLAQTLPQNVCGNNSCEYQTGEDSQTCSMDCAKMSLNPTTGIPSTSTSIQVTGVPVTPENRGIQWWSVFENGTQTGFPGQPSLNPDGSAKNSYSIPGDAAPQKIRIELRSDDARVLAYDWFTVLPGSSGQQCSFAPFCNVSSGGSCADGTGYSNDGSTCYCNDPTCVDRGAFCGQGLCEEWSGETPANCPQDCGSAPTVCGNNICEWQANESKTSCLKDCACINCSSSADDVFELIVDEQGKDIFFDEFYQQQCASGIDPIVSCQMTKDKCLMDQPKYGNYDPLKCEDGYRHCVEQSTLQCGGGPVEQCGNGLCEAGESPDTCSSDCHGSGGGQCTESQAHQICAGIFGAMPAELSFCISGVLSSQSLDEACQNASKFDRLMDPLKMKTCLTSGLCTGGGQTSCGDGVCGPDESTTSCPVDCKVIDTDGDGVLDDRDSCPAIPGKAEYMGCPVADKITVDLHHVHIAGGSSTKDPLSDVQVRVFDRNNSDFRTIAGSKNPDGSQYGVIFEADMGRVGSCTTDVTGACLAGEPAMGDFLVIAKYEDKGTNKIVYVGRPKSPGDFVDTDGDGSGDLATKDLQILKVYKKGVFQEYRGGNKVVVTGSMLEMIMPESAVWDGMSSLYPFVFTSDSTWTVDVCAEVPGGYVIQGYYDENGAFVASQECFKTFVSGETKVIGFQVQETSSPEPTFSGAIKVKGPHGKKHKQDFNVSDIRKKSFEKGVNEALSKSKELKKKRGVAQAADVLTENQIHAAAGSGTSRFIGWAVFGAVVILSGLYLYRRKIVRK